MPNWRRLIFGDWQLKMLGFMIALVLWAYVRTEHMMHLTLDVPLEFRGMPRATDFASKPPRRVEVRLVAHRDVISELEPETVRVVVDLADVKGSTASVALTPRNIERPSGVEVVGIKPGRLDLQFKRQRRKERK